MKKAEREKNILDLKHQKLLNYLNIIIILLVSSFATYLITNFNELKINFVLSLAISVFIIVVFTIIFFEGQLQKIKKEIRKLR